MREILLTNYSAALIGMFLFEKFEVLQKQLNKSIEDSKQRWASKLQSKLANSATSRKHIGPF